MAAPHGLPVGTWVYRSYHNIPRVFNPATVADKAAAWDAVVFGEGTLTLAAVPGSDFRMHGTVDFGAPYLLSVRATFVNGDLHMEALGTTPETENWDYVYLARLAPHFPVGNPATGSIPVFVGTVARAKPHGPASPAGVEATFQLVKK